MTGVQTCALPIYRASHDTTSIMATIEHRFGLRPVSARDARVQDLTTVFNRR